MSAGSEMCRNWTEMTTFRRLTPMERFLWLERDTKARRKPLVLSEQFQLFSLNVLLQPMSRFCLSFMNRKVESTRECV